MQQAPTGTIGYEVQDRIALIEIRRPEKHNALTLGLIRELARTIDRFDADRDADVAILSGQGKSFCSGADVGESQMASREEMEASRDQMSIGHPFFELFSHSANNKPVIAALHGNVLGLGLGLALDCDLIVCDANARLQVTETTRGLGGYRHWALMKARGCAAFADDVCITGRPFTAAQALAAGLFNRVAEAGNAMADALDMARQISASPPLSVRETVRIRRWQFMKLTREVAFQAEPARLHLTEDFAEAVAAFAQKRPAGPFKAR